MMTIPSIYFAFNEYTANWEERKAQINQPSFGGRLQPEKRTEEEKSMDDLEKIFQENPYAATQIQRKWSGSWNQETKTRRRNLHSFQN